MPLDTSTQESDETPDRVRITQTFKLDGPHVAAQVARLPHMVPTRGPIFIGIDVEGDKLKITLWRDGKRNAMYAPVARDWALQRSLPQAIDEAIAFAQSAKSSVTE